MVFPRPAIAAVLSLVVAASPATAQEDHFAARQEVAERLLSGLVGEWTFEWHGPDPATPTMTGRRTYRLLGDDPLQLEWEEAYDESPRAGHGALWYDRAAQQLLYFGLYRPDGLSMLLAGTIDSAGRNIRFRIVPVDVESAMLNAGLVESTLRVSHAGMHAWHRFDDAWIVTFRRRQ